MAEPDIDEIIAGLGDKLQDPFYMGDGTPTPRPSTPAAQPLPVDNTYADDEAYTRGVYSSQPISYNAPTAEELAEINREYARGNAPQADYALLRRILADFGLSEIYDDAVQFVTGESSESEIYFALRDMPAIQDRFSAVFERERLGLPPISFQNVLEFEQDLNQLFSYYGYPQEPGDNLQSTAADLLVNDVSAVEVEQRLASLASFGRQVLEDPDNTGYGQALMGLGATVYDVAEFALDPDGTMEKMQRRLAAASVAEEAYQRDFRLTASEASDLARQGVDQEGAAQGFGQLAIDSQVVNALIGDAADPISRETELAAVAGDVEARAAIERQRERRLAAFSQGGGFATDDEGFGGIR